MKRFHLFFINSLLIFGSTAVFFGVMEIVLRLTVYNFSNYPVSPGPGSVYQINTSEFKTDVRINLANLRGAEIPEKREGEYRILCIGDSFTFGLGVNEEDSYPAVLEKALRPFFPSVTVINGSYGRAAKEEYDFLAQTGLNLKPDLVIIQVYVGNDFYDNLLYSNPAMKGKIKEQKNSLLRALLNWKGLLKEHSKVLDFLWRRLIQIRYVDDWLYRTGLRYSDRGIFLRNYPALENQLAGSEIAQLSRLHELLKSSHVEEAAILVPSKEQVFKKKLLIDSKYDYRKPNVLLKDFFRKNDIAFLDLLDVYETMPSSELKKLYYLQDMHWTIAGNRQAALSVAEFLKPWLAAWKVELKT